MFEHLSDVEFTHRQGHIDLILGVQYSHLRAESEAQQGLPFQPVGKKTKLGWHVIGPDNAKGPTISCINFPRKINLEKFYDFETLGIQEPETNCPQETMSHDGEKAMELFESSRRRLNGRFIIGLPWKQDPTQLPNNYPLARLCLESLESSQAKDLVKAQINNKAIQQCEKNGWARELSTDELATSKNPVYHLPTTVYIIQKKKVNP